VEEFKAKKPVATENIPWKLNRKNASSVLHLDYTDEMSAYILTLLQSYHQSYKTYCERHKKIKHKFLHRNSMKQQATKEVHTPPRTAMALNSIATATLGGTSNTNFIHRERFD